jgi:hypothetical protein
MKVGDLVLLRDDWRVKDIYYGVGVIIVIQAYPEEGFVSHKIQWQNDFSFHAAHELEVISES